MKKHHKNLPLLLHEHTYNIVFTNSSCSSNLFFTHYPSIQFANDTYQFINATLSITVFATIKPSDDKFHQNLFQLLSLSLFLFPLKKIVSTIFEKNILHYYFNNLRKE